MKYSKEPVKAELAINPRIVIPMHQSHTDQNILKKVTFKNGRRLPGHGCLRENNSLTYFQECKGITDWLTGVRLFCICRICF
jgi:hypothetical protein